MKLLIKQVDNFLVNNFALNVNTHLDLEENHALLCSDMLTLAVDSTEIFEPNTLILSVSMGVLAIRIFAFSMRLG